MKFTPNTLNTEVATHNIRKQRCNNKYCGKLSISAEGFNKFSCE